MGMYGLKLCLCIILAYTSWADSARILCIFPVKSKSHFSLDGAIVKGLLSRGHQVTVLSGFPEKNSPANQTDEDISEYLYNAVDSLNTEFNNISTAWKVAKDFSTFESSWCKDILSSDYIKSIVHNKSKLFDIVIAEAYWVFCFIPLAIQLDVPFISVIAPSSGFGVDYSTSNPSNPAYIPIITSGLTKNMNFWQRLCNTYDYLVHYYYYYYICDDLSANIFRKIYGGNYITRNDLYNKQSLSFTYGHPVLLPRANLPNVIELGGLHIQEEKPLLKDIQQFIDDAKDGVIFFSFGSTIRASSLPQEKRRMFAEVFSKIPQRVLWRTDDLNLTEVSENVKFGYWFPQRDILAHKNVRVFISHGGLFGTYEAIYTGTPVIGIPFLYDQQTDIRTLEENGGAVYLEYHELTADILLNSINAVLNDESYAKNMQEFSAIFRDNPVAPLDKAMYWIEYVIRYDGAPHLKSPASNMPLYQYLLLDIIAFVAVTLICLVYCMLSVAKRVIIPWPSLVLVRPHYLPPPLHTYRSSWPLPADPDL